MPVIHELIWHKYEEEKPEVDKEVILFYRYDYLSNEGEFERAKTKKFTNSDKIGFYLGDGQWADYDPTFWAYLRNPLFMQLKRVG